MSKRSLEKLKTDLWGRQILSDVFSSVREIILEQVCNEYKKRLTQEMKKLTEREKGDSSFIYKIRTNVSRDVSIMYFDKILSRTKERNDQKTQKAGGTR